MTLDLEDLKLPPTSQSCVAAGSCADADFSIPEVTCCERRSMLVNVDEFDYGSSDHWGHQHLK